MRLHSWSALVAAAIGLMPNVFYFIVVLDGLEGAEAVWATLIILLVTLPYIIALGAAFSEQAAYRTASLTAALVASIPSTLVLLAVYLIGSPLVPGVVALVIAAISNSDGVHGLAKLGSVVVGLVFGVVLVVAWWPLLTAYESYGSNVSTSGVATAFAIVFVALTGLWLAGAALGRRSLAAA